MAKNNSVLYDKYIEAENKLDMLLSSDNTKHVQVQLLHRYNNVKDATQVVLNHIATMESKSVAEVHKQYDLGE